MAFKSSIHSPKELKILHVYSGNLYGGVESTLSTFGKYGSGVPEFKQEFALCFKNHLWEELDSMGVGLHFLGNTRWRYPWTVPLARWRLKTLLKTQSFDVVICHSAWATGIFGSIARAMEKVLVYWVHDFIQKRSWLEFTALWARPHFIIANSRYTLEAVHRNFPLIPSDVVHCPVSPRIYPDKPSLRKKMRQALSISPSSILIVQVSRMERWKGQKVFIQSLNLIKQDPSWSAILVGGAQRKKEKVYYKELQDLISNYGLADRVKLLGFRTDVSEILAASDIFVQANLSPEPFGIGYIEAMYAGIPVIGVLGGGANETISSDVGVLLTHADPKLLSKELNLLINSKKRRDELGRMGPIRAKEISDPVQQVLRTKALLHTILDKQCHGSSWGKANEF